MLGSRLPDRVRVTVMQGLGLFTIFLGVREALLTRNALLLLGAVLLGGLVGELARVEDRLASAGRRVEARLGRAVRPGRAEPIPRPQPATPQAVARARA